MKTGGDWSGNVRDVSKHARANTARDLADAFEVDNPRIRRSTADEQLGPMLFREPL